MLINVDAFFISALNEAGFSLSFNQIKELYKKSRQDPGYLAKKAYNDRTRIDDNEMFASMEEAEKPTKLSRKLDAFFEKSQAYYSQLNQEEQEEAAANGMTWKDWRIEKKRRADEAEKQEAESRGLTVEQLRRSKTAKAAAARRKADKEKKLQAAARAAERKAAKAANQSQG